MASIEDLKTRIDLHDLADRLGWVRGKQGNYHSPHRKDENPSISVFTGKNGQAWKDHAANVGGTCIDMMMYHEHLSDVGDALRRLHEVYGWPLDKPGGSDQPKAEKSRAEYIADRSLASPDAAIAYLVEQRGISEDVVKRAVQKKAIGFNDWTSPVKPEGQPGHGGPAAAFIVRTLNPGHVVAVDLRYLDPQKNGNVKTQCQGEKHGYGWTSDIKRLLSAHTVYFVESPINALSIECCKIGGSAAFAIRGVGNVDNIPLDWMRGKQAIICMDNDEPFPDGHPQAGIRPGLKAAWALHERMTAMDISALMIDQDSWEVNDLNDFIKPSAPGEPAPAGLEELRRAVWRLEPWLIPGLPATRDGALFERKGKARLHLPWQHEMKYWRYRVRPDFTSYVAKVEQPSAGDGNVAPKLDISELAGFRVAAISRVTIAGATATMTGDEDSQPRTLFALSVQTTRHGSTLLREVIEDKKLHYIDTWKRFGPVFNQSQFLRMVNILESAAHIGARKAANFVGLCFRDGKLIVNEGPDCYFTNPEQQCPYHNLTFPSGSRQDARKVIEAYQQTFGRNAALLALIWGLGGHLKVLLGFWPHLQMQAAKGAGKSTLIKRIERSIAFTMFSGQSLQTEFRLLTSISHTAHPVGWEELSARRQDVIDKAVGMLQENYQYTVNRRGSDMTEFLLSAPVMLAGEDVPVRSLIGKLVRTELKEKGAMMPDDLPRFPVREWLEFLTGFTPAQVRGIYETFRQKCINESRASGEDDGATRMAGNYAALLTAWRLLAEFSGVDVGHGNIIQDLKAQMNGHIKETSADRAPWVWIMETLLAEMARHKFEAPHAWDTIDSEQCLLVRTSDVMHHLSTTPALRESWNGLPVKSDRVFKRQLIEAGVVMGADPMAGHERTVGSVVTRRRVAHLTAISLKRLADFGLHATPPTDAPQ